jgi:tripartite-type tricarboxylate transporter receptor subunit TctC
MPAGTPRDIMDIFDAEIQRALARQEIKERLIAVGGFVTAGGPEQLRQRISQDIAKWARVVRAAGITPE